MTALDLHRLVPEPPAVLLDPALLEVQIRRRRSRRQIVVASTTTVVIVAAILGGLAIGPNSPAKIASGPISHIDGPIIFAKDGPGSTPDFKVKSLFSIGPDGGRASSFKPVDNKLETINLVAASPDGRKVAYVEWVVHPRKPSPEYVHVANADGSDDHIVHTCRDEACQQLLWSPTSDRLLIFDDQTDMLEPDGKVQQICAGVCPGRPINYASWSPDGRQLVAQSTVTVQIPGGTSTVDDIVLLNVDGSDPRQLTDRNCVGGAAAVTDPHCTDDNDATWSADGSTIAFTRNHVTYLRLDQSQGFPGIGPANVERMRPDGSGQRKVTFCGRHPNCSPIDLTWSPTRRWLAFVTFDGNRGHSRLESLHVMDPMTRAEVSLSLPPQGTGDYQVPTIAWAPSGISIAVVEESANKHLATYLVDVGSNKYGVNKLGPARLLANGATAPIAWLPKPSD